MNDNTVAFIGAGNMARCVIAAMIRAGYPAGNIIAANRSQPKLTALASDFGIQTTGGNPANYVSRISETQFARGLAYVYNNSDNS